ncbi:hypothetical protein HYV69_03115 [Candidatus Uhrbacteria bacterium]|nr:hypothetical protein [Candidatus Uhrbacteria bacterium]
MSIWEETAIHLTPDGLAELRTDRVKSTPKGTPLRLKVARRSFAITDLLGKQSEQEINHRFCRFVYTKGNVTWYVVEEPPCIRTVTWSFLNEDWKKIQDRGLIRKLGLDPKTDSKRTRFQFAFPYTIFLLPISPYDGGVSLGLGQIALRAEPLRSLQDDLFWAPFSNQRSTNGDMCLGDKRPSKAKAPCELIDQLIAHWWLSNFNDHWVERYITYQERIPEMATPWEWEYYSKRRPSWVLEADWIRMGMTVEEKLVVGKSNKTTIFADLARIAKSAPEVIPGSDWKKTKKDEARATKATLMPYGQTVQVGDEFYCTNSVLDFQAGKTYNVNNIENCSCGDPGHTALYFQGGGCLKACDVHHYFQRADKFPTQLFQIGSHQIWTGTKFVLVNNDDITGIRTGAYMISALMVDQEGDVKIRVSGLSGWIYITHEQTLLPSIRLFIPELKDNTFTYGESTLKVGTTVNVVNGATKIQNKLLRVESITQEDQSYFVTFEGRQERFSLFSSGTLQMNWETTVYEFSEQRVGFGKKILDLTTHTHILVRVAEQPLRNGTIYEALHFVHPEGKHPLDVDLLIANGNETIPVVRDSKWVFPEAYTPVTVIYQDDALTLKSGEVLVCQITDVPGIKKNEEVTILCFMESSIENRRLIIVLTDGRTICLTQDTLKYFVRKAKPTWTVEEVRRLPEIWFNTSKAFEKPQSLNTLPKPLVRAILKRKSLKGFGQFVSKDFNGNALHIGDIVCIRYIAFFQGNGGIESQYSNKYALVVHSYLNPAQRYYYSYLFLGVQTAEGRVNIRSDSAEFEKVDPEYQGQEARRQMAININDYLQVCTFDDSFTTMIEEGSLVRIRHDVNPKYGRGNVQANEVGRVRRLIENEEVVVDFPAETEWIGLINEIEICPFEPSQHV